MSKKKTESYSSIKRKLDEMQRKLELERQRMSSIMAEALLDEEAASVLGDFSDTDLRRVMALLSGHITDCVAQMQAEKEAKVKNGERSTQTQAQQTAPLHPRWSNT